MIIKTILVDDETDALDILERDLLRHCPDVVVMARCQSAGAALDLIREMRPDLVFLDVEMPGTSGVALAESLRKDGLSVDIIFVTAYRQYGADAFGADAVDYLLKPVEPEKLKKAVDKVFRRRLEEQLASLHQRLERPTRLRVPSVSGFELLVIEEITHCEADGGVTHLFLTDGRRVTAGRNLGYYDDLLKEAGFCRIHHRYLVNLAYVRHYHNPDHSVTLKTGAVLPVAQQRLRAFLERVEGMTG